MKTHSFLLAALVLAFITVAAAADDPFVGTWKMNSAKSKFIPGQEMKVYVVTIEKSGDGYKNAMDGVNATGMSLHIEFVAQNDGKDYPITGNPMANTVSVTRIDGNNLGAVLKRGETAVARMRTSVSTDGKILTVAQTIIGAAGAEIVSTIVFDKQ